MAALLHPLCGGRCEMAYLIAWLLGVPAAILVIIWLLNRA